MNYKEIVDLMAELNLFATAERLRTAVDEEAEALRAGPGGLTNHTTASSLDSARDLYAEDITNWLESGDDPDPEQLIGMRARYVMSWGFAQIIHKAQQSVDNEPSAADQVGELVLDKAALAAGVVHQANTVHQAYHSDGTWMECCHGFCGSSRRILEEARLTPTLTPTERAR